MVKDWISAFRLRTLPLALASIGMGSFLAASFQKFRWEIFLMASLTTLFLQILSNLANDYGDSIHGADSEERTGPSRAVQAGKISSKAMLNAIIIFSILSLFSGIYLLYFAFTSWQTFWVFLGLGLLSILAAITYTAGKKPYGYAGMGDISVMIFFGWVAVLGTFYLHTKILNWTILLPATSCGMFATAVLNINNIRDIESDRKAGKKSIPVRLGKEKALIYHYFLLFLGLLSALIYVLFFYESWTQFLFLITLPFLFLNSLKITQAQSSKEIDPYLKQMALTSLLFVITFGIGQLL